MGARVRLGYQSALTAKRTRVDNMEEETDSSHPAVLEGMTMAETPILDVRSEIPQRRHELIFENYHELEAR